MVEQPPVKGLVEGSSPSPSEKEDILMDTEPKIYNAKILKTTLGKEDHGIMTCWIHIEYERGGQAFGGHALDQYDEKKRVRVGTQYGLDYIMGILRAVGVDSWEQLPGKHVRIEAEQAKIHKIGHIIKDLWFKPVVEEKRDMIEKQGETDESG